MKVIISITLFIFMCGLCLGQNLNCKSLKTGKFKLESEQSGVTMITRTETIQREENEEYGIITEDKIEWINDCTFKLIPYRVIKNDNKIDFSTDYKLEVEIILIKETSYIQKTTSRLNGVSLEKEIIIIK